MYGAPVGTRNITTSTQIVPVGYHARIFNINFVAAGTSTTVKILNNGSAGTVFLQEQSVSSNPKTVDYGPQGHEFPNGLYVLLDAQISYATVSYRQEEKN